MRARARLDWSRHDAKSTTDVLRFLVRKGTFPLAFDDVSGVSPPPAFGKYRVLHQIGSGVLGPVFRAYDADRDRLVAIKTFRLDLVPEDAARLAYRLRALADKPPAHPAIVTIVDAGLEGSTAYVALEMLPGETLDVALRQLGAVGAGRAVKILRTLADAIDAAAQEELDHGALHPRDVFLTADPDVIRVTGFGIARALADVGAKPTIRRPFSAPERTTGGDWDRRADVYSLAEIARALLGDAGTRDEVKRILDGATSERPPSRPASAIAFVESLECALLPKPEPQLQAQPAGQPEAARPPRVVVTPAPKVIEYDRPMIHRPERRESGFPWLATSAVLLAGLVIGGAVGYQAGWSRGASVVPVVVAPPAAVVTSTTVETTPPAPPPGAIATPTPEPTPDPTPVRSTRTQPSAGARRASAAPVATTSKSTGSIDLDSKPRGARVSVDGRPYGTTPLRVPSLSPGNHQVRFELAGHRSVTSTVRIVGGELARLSVSLEQTTLAPGGRRER